MDSVIMAIAISFGAILFFSLTSNDYLIIYYLNVLWANQSLELLQSHVNKIDLNDLFKPIHLCMSI
jgi:hypothetical protein